MGPFPSPSLPTTTPSIHTLSLSNSARGDHPAFIFSFFIIWFHWVGECMWERVGCSFTHPTDYPPHTPPFHTTGRDNSCGAS